MAKLPRVGALVLSLLTLGACGGGLQDAPDGPPERDLDPTPERVDGSESHEFEREDLERAEGAGWLVEFYCRDTPSEAQYVGCLANATEEEICERDEPAKVEAIKQVDFVADPCDRESYGPGEP